MKQREKATANPRISFEIWLPGEHVLYLQTHKAYYYMYNGKKKCLQRISRTSFFHACELYKND